MKTLLRVASFMVPPGRRQEWLAEWVGELWHVPSHLRTQFCLGALVDAFWFWIHKPHAEWLGSPWLLLAGLAVAARFAISSSAVAAVLNDPLPYLLMLLLGILLLPSVMDLSLGEKHSQFGWIRLRTIGFIAAKLLLVTGISLFGLSGHWQVHGFLAAQVLGMRWAILDQRKRCPVCLRRFANPASIGQPSNTMLDWYGTEWVCRRGHGLMYVPGFAMLTYQQRRWINLGPSWKSLFRV